MGSLSRSVCCGSNRDAFRVDPRGLRVVRRSGHSFKIKLCLLFYDWWRPWIKRSDTSRCPCCSEASYEGRLRVFHGYGVRSKSPIRFPDVDELKGTKVKNHIFPFEASMNFCQKQTGKNIVQTWPSAAPCVTHLPMVTEVQTGLSVLDSLSQVQTHFSHASLSGGSFMSGIITKTFLLTFLLMTVAYHASEVFLLSSSGLGKTKARSFTGAMRVFFTKALQWSR